MNALRASKVVGTPDQSQDLQEIHMLQQSRTDIPSIREAKVVNRKLNAPSAARIGHKRNQTISLTKQFTAMPFTSG